MPRMSGDGIVIEVGSGLFYDARGPSLRGSGLENDASESTEMKSCLALHASSRSPLPAHHDSEHSVNL